MALGEGGVRWYLHGGHDQTRSWGLVHLNLTNGRDSGLHVLDSERGHCLTNGSDLDLVMDLEVELDRA